MAITELSLDSTQHLVQQSRAGDEVAFAALVEANQSAVFGTVLRLEMARTAPPFLVANDSADYFSAGFNLIFGTSKYSQFGTPIVMCRFATLFSELPPWWISHFILNASARWQIFTIGVMPDLEKVVSRVFDLSNRAYLEFLYDPPHHL